MVIFQNDRAWNHTSLDVVSLCVWISNCATGAITVGVMCAEIWKKKQNEVDSKERILQMDQIDTEIIHRGVCFVVHQIQRTVQNPENWMETDG